MIPLYPYQEKGVPFLVERDFALLADEMGLGKTPQAIRAADDILAENILVLCPAVVRVNWKREFEAFGTFDRNYTVVLKGKNPIKPGVVICSYDLASRPGVYGKLKKMNFDLVILDEGHYLKNRTSQRTKAVFGAKCKGGGLAGSKTWLLSGTPAPNNPSEIWPMLAFAGVWVKDYWSFVHSFCTGYEHDYGFKITGTKNVATLRNLLKPIMLRRKKMDVAHDLPSIRFEDVYVEKSDFDEEIYFPELCREKDYFSKLINSQEQAVKAIVKGRPGAEKFIKALGPLGDSMSMMRRYIGLSKIKATVDLVKNDLGDGGIEKLVIFAYHRNVIEALRRELSQFHPVVVYGGTPPEKRQKNIDKFQDGKRCRIFIGQIVAAGTGINLTVAHNAIFVEPDWVPSNNAQAAMRLHRYPQKKPVLIRFLMIQHSIDEEISRAYRKKAKMISQVFD